MSTISIKKIFLILCTSGLGITAKGQSVSCPNFQAGQDSLNRLISTYLPVDSATSLYFQFGWAANNLRLYANIILDNQDIMPYAFYKEVEKGFVFSSIEKLQYFYMNYEYKSKKSQCWVRNTPLENPPVRNKEYIIETPRETIIVAPNLDRAREKAPESFGSKTRGYGKGQGIGDGSGSRAIEVEDDVFEIAPPSPMNERIDVEQEQIFDFHEVSESAIFKGGESAMLKFISDNIKYPALAKENNIEGKVLMQFIVTKEGAVRDVRVIGNKLGSGLDEEAIRVIKLTSGLWTPAKQRAKSFSMIFRLPVNFTLN